MKKKVIILVFIVVLFTSGVFIEKLLLSNEQTLDDEVDIPTTTYKNMLSMMLEDENGEYILEKRESWPTEEEGYVFNKELSKCNNGSKVSWDSENNVVLFEGTRIDKCYVYFDKYKPVTINNSSTLISGNSVVITIDASGGSESIAKYFYSKDDGLSYTESTSNTYTFTGLTIGTYKIKYYVKDTNGKTSEIITKEVSIVSTSLADWVKLQYTGTQGKNNLYYHNSSLTNGAGDNSYRYAGAHDEVNNFVCFGSDATTCPDDNLYRIIGVFGDQVKLIKWDYASDNLLGTNGSCHSAGIYTINDSTYRGSKTAIYIYYWNSNETNIWSESNFNTINLNTNYITNLGTTWSDKIAEIKWKVGGNTWENIGESVVKTSYTNEITNPTESTTYNSKVALMYVSDYGYAASPSAWTTKLNSYSDSNITSANWIYMGIWEWTVMRRSNYSDLAFIISSTGYIDGDRNDVNYYAGAVRPVFYLQSSVNYVSGDGTKSLPIRIE